MSFLPKTPAPPFLKIHPVFAAERFPTTKTSSLDRASFDVLTLGLAAGWPPLGYWARGPTAQ